MLQILQILIVLYFKFWCKELEDDQQLLIDNWAIMQGHQDMKILHLTLPREQRRDL